MVRARVLAVVVALVAAVVVPGTGASAGHVFDPAVLYGLESAARAVAVGDIDGDGRQDVVVATGTENKATDEHLAVFVQQPDGSLGQPTFFPTVSDSANHPMSLAIGDVDGDGDVDVVVGMKYRGIEVFEQTDLGLVSRGVIETSNAAVVRTGDVTGDGRLDVVSVGLNTDTLDVHEQQPDGTLALAAVYDVPRGGFSDLALGDINGDGLADVALRSDVPDLQILYQADGVLVGPFARQTTESSNGVAVGDVTGDGVGDVVVSQGGNTSALVGVLAGPAPDTAGHVDYPSHDIPSGVETADFNADGRQDVVVLHHGWQAAGVYFQAPDGTLTTEQVYEIPHGSGYYTPHGVAVGDVDGNGAPDVLIADTSAGLVVLHHTGQAVGSTGFAESTHQVGENETQAVVTVVRQGGSAGQLEIGYSTRDGSGTAGSDYSATRGVLTFDHGQTQAFIHVALLDDEVREGDETFDVVLDNGASTTVTMVNDDDTVADLVTHIELPAQPTAGQRFTVVATVVNNGPEAAKNVELAVELPRRATIFDVMASGCRGHGLFTPSCSDGLIPAGGVARLIIVVDMPGRGWFDATATATTTSVDPNAENNVATVKARIG